MMTLQALIDQTAELVSTVGDEHNLTREVAGVLRGSLANGLTIPEEVTRPDPHRYVMYPLYVAPDGCFSIASAVWNVGQETPIHGHETWGVVGIYSGREHELQYDKPTRTNAPLTVRGEHVWSPGEVTICCTTDNDIHKVWCEGHQPVIGIHIYGADIGSLKRRSYDRSTGSVSWFTSSWAPRSFS